MTGIIVVFSRIENAKSIRNVLVRNGFTVAAACTTGAQALSLLEDYNEALVICGGRLADMMCVELADLLPEGVKLLAVASPDFLGAIGREDIVCLSTPLKVNELCEHGGHDLPDAGAGEAKTQAEAQKTGEEDQEAIRQAKALLMERNRMTEEEAHRYLQKCSMDSGNSMAETAKMVLAAMRF